MTARSGQQAPPTPWRGPILPRWTAGGRGPVASRWTGRGRGRVASRWTDRGWWRRSIAVAGAVLVSAAGLAVGAPAAEAAACSGSSGVTVVVDFGSLGGGVQTGCAGGDPASGLAALSGAGHGYTFVPRQPGLVCQIDGRPNPCNGAPTTAYWSYWHASRGGSWSYSTVGAGGYNPAPGTVEGWAFGAGRQPGIAPPAAPAPPPPAPRPTTAPAPKPTSQPPAAPRTSTPAAGAPRAPGAPGSSAGAAPLGTGRSTTPGTAAASRTTAAPSTSACRTATAGTPSPVCPTATDATSATGAGAAPSTSDSSPPGAAVTEPADLSSKRRLGVFALAVALIGALAVAGVLIARRRRIGPPV